MNYIISLSGLFGFDSRLLITVTVCMLFHASAIYGQDDAVVQKLNSALATWEQHWNSVPVYLEFKSEHSKRLLPAGAPVLYRRDDMKLFYGPPYSLLSYGTTELTGDQPSSRTTKYISISNDQYFSKLERKPDDSWVIAKFEYPRSEVVYADMDNPKQLAGRLRWLTPDNSTDIHAIIVSSKTDFTRTEVLQGKQATRYFFRRMPSAVDSKLRTTATLRMEQAIGTDIESGSIDISDSTERLLQRVQLRRKFKSDTYTQTFTVSYETRDGHSVLKHCDLVTDGLVIQVGEQFEYRDTFNYDSIRPDPLEFWLSYYGLPEPEGVTPPRKPIPLYVYLLSGAAVLALIAVVCRWLLRRRTRAVVPPPAV